MNVRKTSFAVLSTVFLLNACKKIEDTSTVLPVEIAPSVGAYILSEGSYNGNDTKLSFYNKINSTVTGDYFLQQNPSITIGLGGLGNDIIQYGSKLYVVMDRSGLVTVLNAGNATFIKNISFKIGNFNKEPRYAAAAKGKVYVTAYDNTVSVIDTSLLTITKTIVVGNNPEGIAAFSNYLYVANSGGLNYPNLDSTVSLIDLNTELEVRKIKVGLSPYKVEINAAGNVFVSAYGNYPTIPPSISFINGAANTSSVNLGSNFSYSNIRISGDIAYLYNNYGGTGTAKVYNSALNTIVRNEFITDGTAIQTPYGINVDEQNGDVYITDAKDFISAGSVTCFGSNGVKKFSFSVSPGVNPNKIIFKR
jgi:YVTN family beta-propeller protein